MRFFRKYKKEVASFLLVALFYGVVLEQFSAYAKTLPQKIVYTNTYARENEIETLGSKQVNEEFISREEHKSSPIVSTINESVDVVESSVLYPADITYGQIGKTDKIAFDSPEDNLFTITINDEIDSKASYKLSYEVYGVANVAGVTKSINTNTSKGGFFIDKKQNWNRLTEYVLPKKLKKGKNTILFTSDLKTDTGYLVRNVQLEKVKTNKEEILLVNDIVKDIDGKQIYVQGIVQNDLADIKLYANNKPIQLVDNSFEFVVNIDDIDTKQLHLEVREQEQKLVEKQFDIQKLNKTSFTKTLDYAFNQLKYKVTNGEEHQYTLENMSVVIKDSSYVKDFTLSIQELRPSDYAPTGMTLHNVTKNQSAYRFLPDGIVFDKDVELRLKYDLKALPRGYNPKDVQVFYFDTNTKQWTKVKVIDILEDTQEVVAVTNHFTDYIAGVIQEPESPETTAFAPTTISGIQVANPTENVAMVSVPQINDKGDAALNFPLMLPPARQGMQPELSINYNSSLDDGDFGVGWNLSMPYIEIDTRWGVAQIDPSKETESYLFNGEELLLVKSDNTLYVPHKEPLINRVNGDVEFRKMQHDPTIIITRKGNNTNYVWKVLDTKTGWTSTYELKGQSSRWNLTSTIDNDGNYVNYYYEEDTKDRKNDMLSKIVYNGNAKLSDPTRIKGTFGAPEEKIFIQIERSDAVRTDRKINNRNNTESPKLIDKIYVYTRANDVESGKYALVEYTFEYKKGQFGRTLLSKIIQDAKNNYDFKVFCCPTSIKQEYLFDYHDDIGTGSLFESTGKTFFTYDDYRTQYDKFGVYLTALGGSEGKSIDFNGGGSVGAVFPFDIPSYIPFSNSATIGVHAGGNSSNSEVKIMMIDIDGDGLVDKVFENGTSYYYRKNLGKEFSKDIYRINNLPRLGYSKTDSGELGANINIIAGSVGKSFSNSGTTTYSYVVDANADGIPDIVDNERVYFGYIDPVTKLPAYNLDSSVTPSIVVKEEDVAPILTPMPTVELSNGLMDIVMVWRAPKTGQVQIEGQITKQHISLQSGVKFSIEKLKKDDMGKATFVYGPYLMLSNSDNHNITIDVSQGDLIFFRTHSNQTPAQELGVTWNPKVTYKKGNFDSSLSYPHYSSSYQESFIVGTTKEELFKEQGKYRLEWPSFTLNAVDKVRIKVSYYKQNTSKTTTGVVPIIGNNIVIYEEVSGYNSSKTYYSPGKILDMNTINDNDPTSFHYIKVEVLADSEVNWKEIDQKFKPKLVSLDGKADIYLTPSYLNYSNIHTSYYPSNFTSTSYGGEVKLYVNHDFQLPNCTKQICEDRYIHLVIKNDKNKIVNYNGNLLKFRYKVDANGNIISREQSDGTPDGYVNVYFNPFGIIQTYDFQTYDGLKFYIEYYTSDYEIAERLNEYQNTNYQKLVGRSPFRNYVLTPRSDYEEGADNTGLFRANIYSSENVTGWGTMYRNWGQFAYKGPNANATYEPIVGKDIYLFHPAKTTSTGKGVEDIVGDPSLTLDAVDKNFDDIAQLGGNVSNSFAVLMPNKKRNHWESHERLYISETNVSPYTRFLTDEIPSLKPPTVPVQAYGAYGINKNSYFKNNTVNKSIGFLGLNAGDTRTEGYGSISNEFIDVNGDGFPDVVGDKIQLTSARGGLSQRIINNTFNMDVEVDGKGFLIGGSSAAVKAIPNYVKTLKSSTPTVRTATGNQVSGSLSNTNFVTKNNTKKFYLDINGDGLVDIIQSDGKVLMNYGNRFEEQQSTWNMSTIQTENVTRNFSGSGGYGYGKDTHKGFSNLDLSFGLSFSESQSEERVSYVDINGDGLPEKIVDGTTYYINLGTKFDTTARKLPQAQRQKALDGGVNAGGTICVIIPIPFLMIGPKFCGSLGGAVGKNYSLDQVRYMDYDGDGYTDVVTSTRNDNVTVYFSRIKRTNLLKKVTQSTGATIELDYDVTNPVDKSVIGSTYKMPYKKWALTKVKVFDGFVGDGEDYTNYNYEYFNGYKDRKERSFLGFGITKAHLLDKNGQVFRTDVTEYLLNDMTDDQLYRPGTSSDLKQYLYKKGLVKKVSSLDKEKKVLSESMYQYKFYDVNQLTTDINTSNVINAEVKNYTNKISVLPLLIKKENNLIHYEQGKSTSFTQATTQKFTLYDKKGNIKQYVDVDRGLTVDMEYQIGNLKVLPISHRISNTTGGQMLGLTKAISNDGIRIHEVRKYLNSTKYLTTNFEYDNIGNITKKIFPLVNGKRFSYEYDYVDTVSSANGNANPRKVFPSNIRDSYGNKTFNAYTAFGNVTKTIDMYNAEIEYEYDQLNRLRFVKGPYEKEWTIKHDFVDNRHAITQHNLGTNEQTKQPIILHTSIINDGLGRALQVKKELMPNPDNRLCGNLPGVRLSVSGDVIYDEFGRVIENYLSEEEVDCNNANALRGRLLSYYNGARSVEKKISRLYDYRDRVTDELVHGTNALTKTKYGFGKDKLGKDTFTQEVTLPEGNKTISYTNEFGLQTGQKQIGNGQELWTTSTYDNLGRVIQVEDALGRKSLYNYDWFGRVLSKNLPFSGITSFVYDDLGNIIKKTDSNGITINYTYDFNRLLAINEPSIQTNFTYDKGGRIEKMEDLSGKQNFKYGKLGEVIEDTKELMDIKGVKRYFTTRYKYDSWGRILEIVYPDREKVKYTYNRVGQLVQINGNKEYLAQVLYNHFDQPYYIKYGNGVETKQEFDLTERLRAVELKAPNKNNRNLLNVFSRNTYQYDLNNNIVSQENKFSQHNVLNVGGVSWKQYEYDDFNRLKNASGNWDGLLETHDFKLEMSYLKDHAIESKKQVHIIYDKNTKVSTPSENSLNRTYNYDSDKAQLKHLVVEKNNLNSDQNFEYDQKGNILSIDILNNASNTGFQQRIFKWNANNNIVSIKDDAGKVVNYYTYDGKGERVSKKTGGEYSLSMNNNAPQTGIYLSEVLYPSGNLVVNEQYYTKHYYANGKRLASSINDLSQVDSFENSSFNNEKTSLHETDLKQKSSMSSKSVLNSKEEGRGIFDPSVPIGPIDPNTPVFVFKGFCQNQIDYLLDVFYNTSETIDCKNDILKILEKNKRFELVCLEWGPPIGPFNISRCLRWGETKTYIDYCAALEEINKLDCIKRTSDGMIIDPITGIPYDPNTGIPIDLGTKKPQDRLQLDCYNRFVRYINYYEKKQDKPDGYDEIAKYLKCIQPEYEQCYLCSQYEAVTRDPSTGICTIDYCKINVPDIPEEPEVPVVIPVFPDRKLDPGVNDTWQDSPPAPTIIVANPLEEEVPVWWYHSDHLGSSSYITDILGKPCQYVEYLPFGEVMTEQSTNNVFDNIYKFNGKELDESTGYYYYGARYYDPGMSIFLSVDPLAEQFPNWNPYHYVHNNPINLVDPTGMAAEGGDHIRVYYNKRIGSTGEVISNYWDFNGVNGDKAPKDRFVSEFLNAYNYNINNGGGDNMKKAAFSNIELYEISESAKGEGSTAYNENGRNLLTWNSSFGLQVENGDILSPATILEHELDHSVSRTTNPVEHYKNKDAKLDKYTNNEEKRVITGSETKTARANGEINKSKSQSRYSHRGTYIEVNSSTSNKAKGKNDINYNKGIFKTLNIQ